MLRDFALGDQERTAAAPERAASVEQHELVGTMREGVKTELRDVDVAAQGPTVERLHIVQNDAELQPLEVDALMDDRIEYEAVIGTRREAE